MNQDQLKALLEAVSKGEVTPEAAQERIAALPFADLGFANVDLHRAVRHGGPEVIYCAGKTAEQIIKIVATLKDNGQRVLATRAESAIAEAVQREHPELHYFADARVLGPEDLNDESRGVGKVMVVTAGTSDLPVAEEALLTARAFGSHAEVIHDVGVAGLHRLLARVEKLQSAKAIIVAAGMEGALPSVVGGLTRAPVIAVPTSVGYGSSFGGLTAMLGMLNSCASNVTVVNIDNGFGAGYVASLINRQSVPEEPHA